VTPQDFTREAVSQWMRATLDDVRVNGDEAAAAFGVDDVSDNPDAPAPLDDDGHWVWELAVDAAEAFEAGEDDEEGDAP